MEVNPADFGSDDSRIPGGVVHLHEGDKERS